MDLDTMAKAQAFDELCDELGVIGNSVKLKAHALRVVIGALAVKDCDCAEKIESLRADERRALGITIGMDDYRPAEEFTREAIRKHIEWMEQRAREAGAAQALDVFT